MIFQLTKDYLTGIKLLDKEHAKLFQIINETSAILDNDAWDIRLLATNLLQELSEYAATHFLHEEEYMEKINDPELPLQKMEHAAFIRHIQNFSIHDDITMEDLNELIQFLVHWLFRHILHSDGMIGKVILNEKEEDKENAFAFTEKYMTNISFVDEEHRQLFDIIYQANSLTQNQQLQDNIDKYDEIIDILHKLREYTEKHFRHEEEYMQEIGYPGLSVQQKAHRTFINKMANVDYNELEFMDDQQEFLLDLIEYLLYWLSSHIMNLDKEIGRWAEKNK